MHCRVHEWVPIQAVHFCITDALPGGTEGRLVRVQYGQLLPYCTVFSLMYS